MTNHNAAVSSLAVCTSFEDTIMALTPDVRLCSRAISMVVTVIRQREVVRFLGKTREMIMFARSIGYNVQDSARRFEAFFSSSN